MAQRGRGRGSQGPRGGFQNPRAGGSPARGGYGGRGGAPRGRGGGPSGPEIYQPGTPSVPDGTVEALENTLIPSQPSAVDLSRLNITQNTPLRPGYGSNGTTIVCLTNHFKLLPSMDKTLHRYSVEVTPEVTNARLKRQLFKLLLRDSPLSPAAPGLASDFVATVITSQPLTPERLQFELTFRDEDEAQPDANAKHYKIRVAASGVFRVADLLDFATSSNLSAALANKDEVIQLLNIIASTFPKLQHSRQVLSTKNNRHFSVTGPNATSYDLGEALDAWRGYFSSVRTATSRLLINVQIKHLALFKSQRLDTSIKEFQPNLAKLNAAKLERFIKRIRVDRKHLKARKGQGATKPKTIFGLATLRDGRQLQHPPRVARHGAKARDVQIWIDDKPPPGARPNSYITVLEFFKRAHNITLADETPVVNVGTRENPSYLPPEVCVVVPAQPALAKLTPRQTANMINFAVRPPYMNAKSIAEVGLREIGLTSSNPTSEAFGLQVDSHMVAVNARILVPPTLKYASNRSINTRFGAWNMIGNSFASGANLTKWSVLWIQSSDPRSADAWRGNPGALTETLKAFTLTLQKYGINASKPLLPGVTVPVVETSDVDDDARDEVEIKSGFKRLLDRYQSLQFVLVILPGTSSNTYNTVKRCGDIDFGVNSTCVIGSKFAKENNDQYFANVGLKVNLKLGGVNHTLDPKKLGFISEGKTMVVGIDVTHPSPGSAEGAPSVAAMVASTDGKVGRFLATISVQGSRDEMVSDLGTMLKSRLVIWRRHNENQLPENILVYRDGVSAGQYDLVLDNEWPLLADACKEVYPAKGKQPAFAILIAGKRIHTRFYPTTTDENLMDTRSSNIKHGTVVDRTITDARSWDFFMAAHTALKGTTIPCHYFVVLDQIFTKVRLPPGMNAADLLEEITHSMSYLYGRATRAVSYAPPAYYADMVCERARCYLSSVFSPTASHAGSVTSQAGGSRNSFALHDNIKDTMFFI